MKDDTKFDLAVIGGGPLGCAAAITAARAGAKVVLLERGHFARQKVCGEFVSAESLDLLTETASKNFKRDIHALYFAKGDPRITVTNACSTLLLKSPIRR